MNNQDGSVPKDFRHSKGSLQRCTTVPTRTPRTNHHTRAQIRIASWFQPFLNVALKSMNGLTGYRMCNAVASTPHHASSCQIRVMSESPPSTSLTTPICDMWLYRWFSRLAIPWMVLSYSTSYVTWDPTLIVTLPLTWVEITKVDNHLSTLS
jgi:hypothetical protein